MEKIITTVKKDTSYNWSKAKNFIPKDKEYIIYTDLFPNGLKIGDGVTLLADLPFVGNYSYRIEDNVLTLY